MRHFESMQARIEQFQPAAYIAKAYTAYGIFVSLTDMIDSFQVEVVVPDPDVETGAAGGVIGNTMSDHVFDKRYQ